MASWTETPPGRRLGEALLVAVGVLAFYSTHLDLSRMQSGGDFANLFWPMKEFRVVTLLRDHAVPLWNPYIFMGSPALATLQHAFFYPVDILFFWFSPTIGALTLYQLAHQLLAGIGTWWWARRACRVAAVGSVLAGIAFACCGWFWGQQEHINQVGTVAWMPWIAGTALLFLRGEWDARRFVLAYSGFSTLQFLVGHPQAAFYTHLFVAVLGIAWHLAHRRRPTPILLPCAAAGACFLLLIAVQLLPALELNNHSYRVFRDPKYSLSYSMPPEMLWMYLQPGRFGDYIHGFPDRRAYNEYGIYVGVTTLALLVPALLARRRLKTFLFAAAIAGVLLTLGGNTDPRRLLALDFTEFPDPGYSLHDLYIHVLPPAGGFRVPARIIILASFAIATLAGMGAEWLASRVPVRALAWILPVLVLLDLRYSSRDEKFRYPKDTAPLLLEWEADRDLRPEPSIDDRIFRLTPGDTDFIIAERQQSWEERIGDGLTRRWMRWQENNNVVVELPSVEGYEEGLAPVVRTKDFLFAFNRHFRQARPDRQLLALLGIGQYFADVPVDPQHMPPDPAHSRGERLLYRNPWHRGAAFWAAQAQGIAFNKLDGPWALGAGAVLGSYENSIKDYGTAAAWDSSLPPLHTALRTPNKVEISSSNGTVHGDAILAMAFYPGWVTRVGDHDEPLKSLSAVHWLVPEGAFRDGRALVRYEPNCYRIGLFLTALGVFVWCLTLRARR